VLCIRIYFGLRGSLYDEFVADSLVIGIVFVLFLYLAWSTRLPYAPSDGEKDNIIRDREYQGFNNLNTERNKDLNLFVHGFARKHSDTFVPDVLLQMIESYHTMWIHTRFKKAQMQRVIRPIHAQPMTVFLKNATVEGQTVAFSLKLEKCVDSLLVELLVTFKPGMEELTGKFDFALDREYHDPAWRWYMAENARGRCYGPLCLPVVWKSYPLSELDLSKRVTVSAFIDLASIRLKQPEDDDDY